jgi:hypothetical protein
MACWTPDGNIEGAVSAGFNGVTQPIADPFTISVFFGKPYAGTGNVRMRRGVFALALALTEVHPYLIASSGLLNEAAPANKRRQQQRRLNGTVLRSTSASNLVSPSRFFELQTGSQPADKRGLS